MIKYLTKFKKNPKMLSPRTPIGNRGTAIAIASSGGGVGGGGGGCNATCASTSASASASVPASKKIDDHTAILKRLFASAVSESQNSDGAATHKSVVQAWSSWAGPAHGEMLEKILATQAKGDGSDTVG